MTNGIVLSLIGVTSIGIAGAIQKFLAKKYENHLALVIQYIGVVLFVFLWLLLSSHIDWTNIRPHLTITHIGLLWIIGIIWFIGILFLRKWFEKMNSWVVLIIANISVFLMYFANLYLFDGGEKLPLAQTILAILFFIVITQFLVNKPLRKKKSPHTNELKNNNTKKKKLKINRAAIYPIVTAISRSIFFVGNTYFIKNNILRPSQSQFFTEWTIFLVTIIVFLWKFKASFSLFKKIVPKDLLRFTIETLSLTAGSLLLYYAYINTPANVVNVLRLFGIIVTALLTRIFLKDTMSKRNIILMSFSFIILILFIFSDQLF